MLTSTWAHSVQYCTLRISKCFIPWVKFHFKFFRSILSTEWIFKRLLIKLIIKTEKDCGCPRSAKMLYLSLLPLSRGFCPYPINIVSYAAVLFSSRNAPPTFVGRSVAWRDKEWLRRRLPLIRPIYFGLSVTILTGFHDITQINEITTTTIIVTSHYHHCLHHNNSSF